MYWDVWFRCHIWWFFVIIVSVSFSCSIQVITKKLSSLAPFSFIVYQRTISVVRQETTVCFVSRVTKIHHFQPRPTLIYIIVVSSKQFYLSCCVIISCRRTSTYFELKTAQNSSFSPLLFRHFFLTTATGWLFCKDTPATEVALFLDKKNLNDIKSLRFLLFPCPFLWTTSCSDGLFLHNTIDFCRKKSRTDKKASSLTNQTKRKANDPSRWLSWN